MPFELDWGQDFDDGIKVLKEGRYDVCLLDSSLGTRGGVEFIREAKANGIKTPIIFLAEGKEADRDVTALRAGAADYLVKGRIHPVFLRRAIRYALERFRSEQKADHYNKAPLPHRHDLPPLSTARELQEVLSKAAGLIKIAQSKTKQDKSDKGLPKLLNDAFDHSLQALSLSETLLGKLSRNFTLQPAVNVQQLILDTIDLLAPHIAKNISLTTSINRSKQFLIEGDVTLLRQVLVDIILYRAEQMPQGGTINTAVTLYKAEHDSETKNDAPHSIEYVCIEMKDLSASLNTYDITKIFAQKKHLGLVGLSLTAVPSIIQAHNGWCTLAPIRTTTDDDPQKPLGAVFSIYIPLYTPLSFKAPLPRKVAPPLRGEILVIDEDGSFAELTKLYLDAAGVGAKSFSSAAEALAWYSAHTKETDLILLDISISDINSSECFSILKKINPQAKIAIFSAEPDIEAKELLNQGALKYFQKPTHYPLILAWIMEELKESKN